MLSFNIGPRLNSLLFWAYAIGCFDLITALLFTVVGLRTICHRLSWLTIFAILFGIFWVSMIGMLLVGIHGRNPRCVRVWIIFSCFGILAEILLILYAIFSQSSFQKGLVRNGVWLILGLIVECIFLYIVHRFYETVAYCEACHKPRAKEKDNHHREPIKDSDSSTTTSHPPSVKGNVVHNTHTSANPMRLSFLRSFDRHSAP